jgi:hypothetical protein
MHSKNLKRLITVKHRITASISKLIEITIIHMHNKIRDNIARITGMQFN